MNNNSYKVKAMLHSKGEIVEVNVISNVGKNYIVEYDGVVCTAIYNCFNGLYYADDLYGRINKD